MAEVIFHITYTSGTLLCMIYYSGTLLRMIYYSGTLLCMIYYGLYKWSFTVHDWPPTD